MRILNIVTGLAVLFTTLAYTHLLHHYYSVSASLGDVRNPAFVAGMVAGIIVGIFSFVGAGLLLRRGR